MDKPIRVINLLRRVANARGSCTVTLHTDTGDIPYTLDNVQFVTSLARAFTLSPNRPPRLNF